MEMTAAVVSFGPPAMGRRLPAPRALPIHNRRAGPRRSDDSGLARGGAIAASNPIKSSPRRRRVPGSLFALICIDQTPPGSAAPRAAPCSIDSLQPHQAAPHAALPPRALDRTCEIWAPAPRTATTPSRRRWPTASRTRTSWRTASVKPTSTFSLGTTATSGVIGPRSPAAGRATTSARARRSARAERCSPDARLRRINNN